MGVDTKMVLRKGTTITDIKNAIERKYGDVIVNGATTDLITMNFNDGKDARMLSIFHSRYSFIDYNLEGVLCSLGMWGKSVEIGKYLCETLGGYLDENDCDEEDFYPINYELYSQGTEFTKLDEFRHKIIVELGYDKLNQVMKLFNEYKNLA